MQKKENRVFLDSNVILSGFLSDRGSPCIILDLFSLGMPHIHGATGQYNIIEIERNLTKKAPEMAGIYKEFFPLLNLEIIPLPAYEEIRKLSGHTRDKDLPVLASAIKYDAAFLVTGDKKDFLLKGMKGKFGFKILSPSEFLEEILPEILKNTGEE